MTGCGGRCMSCSRKSIEVMPPRVLVQKTARGLSRNGIRIFRPLAATLLKRPSRSINITDACGTILIVLTAMISSTMPMKNRRKISRKLPTTSAWNSINGASDMIHLRRFADYDGVHYISVRTGSGSDRIKTFSARKERHDHLTMLRTLTQPLPEGEAKVARVTDTQLQ